MLVDGRTVPIGAGTTAHRPATNAHYGFSVRGLHRIQITTLADNHAMIAAAVRAGFVLEGTSRDAAWVDGGFADRVALSQLSGEWSPAGRSTGR